MNFKELFDLNKQAMLPNAQRVRKRVLKRRSRFTAGIIGTSACAAVALAVGFGLLLMGRGTPITEEPVITGAVNIIDSVVAVSQSEIGMKTDSVLKITTTEDVTAGELETRLAVTPTVKYSLRKKDPCSYELKFADKLKKDTLYNIAAMYNGTVVNRWAFQTEADFTVTGATPANESQVPVDSVIEVTFSHADVTGFEQAFKVSPAVEGSFEHYGRTWAFVPGTPLEPAKLYTVTIDKSIVGPDDLGLKEDYVFAFSTAPQDSYAYLIYQQNEAADTFLVDETPLAAICYNNIDVSAASVKVFRFTDSKVYIDAYKQYVHNGEVSGDIAIGQNEPYLTFRTTPALTTDYNTFYEKAAFINYPEPLPLGYYFAEIEVGGRKMYQLLQSTTLSVYTLTSNGDYTVWVNDTQSGEPLNGAKITLDGFKDKDTGAQGIATFKGAAKEMDHRVMTVENGEYPYVVMLNGDGVDNEILQQSNFYTYISTNSQLYKAGDTVKVFGMILPRKHGVNLPEQVALKCDFSGREYVVKVQRNGYFEQEISLNNTAASYGNIDLMVKETCLATAHFMITDYELPTYEVTVSTDKTAYEIGQEIRVTAQVTYMDGTPAAGVLVASDDEMISGYTDENGCFYSTAVAAQWGEYYANTNYPEVHSLGFRVTTGTDTYCSGSAAYMVFSSKYFIESTYQNGKLMVEVDAVDLSKTEQIDRDQIYSEAVNEKSFIGTAASSVELIGELHEITYEKVPNGTTYDAINKKVVYSWLYEEKDQLVRTFEMTVTNGIGSVELPEEPDENRNYYVILRVIGEDDAGIVQAYLIERNYTGRSQQDYNVVADKTAVNIGDSVDLLVRNGSDNEAINSGSVLYTAVCGGIVEHFYSVSARYTLQFKKEYAPDILVYGAYFDGKHVYTLGYEYLQYEQDHSKLNIEMQKNKLQYRPGDEVTLHFRVTDVQNKPVTALLNLSVLDRALYLLSGEFTDPLYELYRSKCYSAAVYTTCSHRAFNQVELLTGEGGSGDGEGRGDFEDAPYFESVWTDSKGEATVTFTLPDTITEWKVVARALTQDVQAGMDTFALRSTQDFFTQVSMSETVKINDDFSIAVKGEGVKAKIGDICTFQVGITDRDGNVINTLKATAQKSKYTYLNFGQLDEGVYTVYIQSECGDLKDSMIRRLTVEKEQATAWIHQQRAVAGSLELNLRPQRGNVTLTVVDEQRAFWLEAMARLKSSIGTRVDQVLGQYLADLFYSTGSWMDPEKTDYSVIRSYMNYDGVKLMPDSEYSDLYTTAKLAAVAPEFCDKESLQFVFEQYLNNRYAARVDVIAAYFGLAALGKPVLTDLSVLYSTQADFTPEEAAYLALAFAYSGDHTTARYIFNTQLKGCLVTEGDVTYAGIDGEVAEELTGCCALLSNRLSLESSRALINFILETDTSYTLLNLELISYLSDHVTDLTGENEVMISTGDGRSESYTYQKIDILVLNLSPEQAADIRILNTKGNSVISCSYAGGVEELRQLGESLPMGAEIPSALQVGENAQIVLHLEIPEDFEIPSLSLTLPAGLRLVNGMVQTAELKMPITDQYNSAMIQTSLFYGSNTVIIEVRGALPGSYELEPIMITNAVDDRYMATESAKILITQ